MEKLDEALRVQAEALEQLADELARFMRHETAALTAFQNRMGDALALLDQVAAKADES